MSFPKKSNNNHHQSGPKIFEAANGLDEFLKTLERHFFARVGLQCKYNNVENRANLIIDLHLNFGLAEFLRHFNNGDWSGTVISKDSQITISSHIERALEKLNAQNSHSLDISEISLHFQETSIIISRLYKNSIPKQLGNIISKIGQHFVYFTKGLTEMPYEIYVPVFEDISLDITEVQSSQSSYFDYWGLYFDDEQQHQVMIYSLAKKKLYKEDLFLFE